MMSKKTTPPGEQEFISVDEFLKELEAFKPDTQCQKPDEPKGHVVVPHFGRNGSRDYQKLVDLYRCVEGIELEVRHHDDIVSVRRQLVAEFPYAARVIETMLMPTFRRVSAGKTGIVIEPTLLHGGPGLGKSRFARRFCELLGLHAKTVCVAASADDQIFGLSRGWSSAHGSVMLDACREGVCANPVIVLDEIDKTISTSHNGNVQNKILPLLEKSENASYHEPFLAVPCDFSFVGWILTANSLDTISAPLRSRLRVLQMPEPSAEHVPAVVNAMMKDIAREQELDEAWLPKPDALELDILQRAYNQHKSIRVLRRQLDAILDARPMTMH
jgi:ATP-dependent Lon protease